jgi:hypothetical protein
MGRQPVAREKERFVEQELKERAARWGDPITFLASDGPPKGKKAPARKVLKGVKKVERLAGR